MIATMITLTLLSTLPFLVGTVAWLQQAFRQASAILMLSGVLTFINAIISIVYMCL